MRRIPHLLNFNLCLVHTLQSSLESHTLEWVVLKYAGDAGNAGDAGDDCTQSSVTCVWSFAPRSDRCN